MNPQSHFFSKYPKSWQKHQVMFTEYIFFVNGSKSLLSEMLYIKQMWLRGGNETKSTAQDKEPSKVKFCRYCELLLLLRSFVPTVKFCCYCEVLLLL